MRMLPGRFLLAAGIAGLGGLGIAFHDFAVTWQLAPGTLPWHDVIADITGALLVLGGLALLVGPLARFAAPALAALLFVFVLLLRLPPLVAQPLVESNWYGLGETMTLVAGALTVFAGTAVQRRRPFARPVKARTARALFALALLPIGLSHFFYLRHTAALIPSWIPWHISLAHVTGAAHIAAAIGILLGIGLAASLETWMLALFTALVWAPAVVAQPANGLAWSELLLSTAITGAAWAVAESITDS